MTDIPLKPQNEKFTDRQWQAIFDKGDNLLVSASAGSGKTTVLVRRVIEKLKSGSNIDELLIVTFTEAAAREMKERIQEALQLAVNQESNEKRRQHFTKQLVLLPTANISTLHSFCLTIIRRFYFLIDLDPVFRMLTDETEILLLKEEVWGELREEKYEAKEEVFFQLTENFSGDRSDEGLTDLIMSLYTFARANPDPKAWLASLKKNYEATDGLEKNPLYQSQIKPLLINALQMSLEHYQQAFRLSEFDPAFEKIHGFIAHEQNQAQRLYDAVVADNLATAYSQVEGFDLKQRYPGLRKAEYKALSDEIGELRKTARSYLETGINEALPYSPQRMTELMEKSLPLVEKMAELTAEFIDRYQQRKQDKGVLDFNDLEHFALQILQGNNGAGSEAATYYRTKFEEVLVDEYQDVNRLQEALLFWVRQEESPGNMFMVGDVKQSIYAFRLADPTLFIEKYLSFGQEKGGRRIVLAENFRSRQEVLAFTNLVFQQLMDERVGQIPYDEAAALIPGFPAFPESDQFHTELLIYEKAVEEDSEVVESKTEGELYVTALKIRELIDQKFEIFDKKIGSNRPVDYRDIVLLTPTKKNNLDILDVFKKFAIPLEVNDAQNYFQATEIKTMISLLQIIDNPYNDIPLAAVLRSPIVGLQEDELALIRLANTTADFYQALLEFTEVIETPLQEKVVAFLETFARWRDHSKKLAIPELLWEIYEESAYPDYVLGLPAGQQRYANLIALVDRAQSYERSSFRGLYQFIRFIEKMQEKDKDLAEPLAMPVENAVRVMTIHASKGLEFPIVFLLDMSKNFNNQDFTRDYIFEERLGAGIQYIDPDRRVRYETMPYQAIQQLRLKKAFSEEMRKLYVALTRAEQKLFLVGSYKDRTDALKKWREALSQKELVLNPVLRMKKTNILLNWVGMSLMRHPEMETIFSEASERQFTVSSDAHFKIQWWNQEQISTALQTIEEKPTLILASASSEEGVLPKLQQRLEYQYPFEKAPMTTSYQSVSEIKRIFDDPDNLDDARLTWQSTQEKAVFQQYRYTEERLSRPQFIEQTATDAASVGTATHTTMQMLPLTQKPTAESIEDFIQQLVSCGTLDITVAKKIDRESLLWFFGTPLGEQLLANSGKVKREQPFAMLKNAEQIFVDYDEVKDELLIHGIIDGFIEFEDHLILYDFKTDHIINGDTDSLAAKYRGQLKLYREALEEAYNKPVTETYLVLLSGKQLLTLN
ncbi:helicase-exonuclease AddAB subunit AddA [Enterococcus sp. JM9B]|uniref:helicase-exonuclease AddAB subunit AddA n=1 Tax=Enterococcus sp. JM9B TaxID=1857216 RepID=UPI001374E09A|nr:helicase-exonuclease AddAB subunit AddA [Enterococcus sp. JM9B]KAF1301151.1 helicase-exonuclease AddAB subunit AddA [Enterococcus sp. JM9B]